MNLLSPIQTRILIRFSLRMTRGITMLFVSAVLALATYTLVRAAPSITVTLTDAFIGGDGDGKADPGETIEYTAVITNSGADPATGVTFNDILDLNTTLVGGSINVSPLAGNDAYQTIGNTLLEVGVTASGNPAVITSGSIFDNDTEFLSDTFTLKSVEADTTAPFTTATEQGGSVTVESDGNFSYTPAVGFSGTDNFDYVITDDGPDNVLGNSDDLTGAGRVTITVTTQRVWYVKNDSTPGGLGRSNDPLDTLAEAQTASAANDTIYVFAGNGTTSGQSLGIVLKAGQRLLGEGVALTVPVSVNGGPNPTTLRAAGSQPQIDNTTVGGNGVSVTDLTGVEIHGLNIAGNTNAIDVTTTAANSGSFEIANNTIRAAGVEGIDVNGGGSGTLTVSIHDNTVTSTGNGIDVARTAGSVNITAFDDNVVTGNTGGIGINVVGTGASILFDTNPGTAAFDTVSGGTTTIGQSGNGVGTSGFILSNIRGDLSFSDLDVYSDAGTALFVNGTSPNYTGTSGTRFVVSTSVSTLSATGGAAADITDANVNLVLTSLTSTNSSGTGVSLTRVSGTFTGPSGSTITNATTTDFSINGGSNASANVAVTYGGTITDDLGTLIQIQNVTASSTYTFTGAITDGNNGDGSGISLTGNSGATITFAGGLLLSTGANPAFTATGGGTVNVCDDNPCVPAATGALVNTLTTTTSTALNVANTNIGANNLEFKSISSSGGTGNGIILDTTGSSGGLKVVGDGTNTAVGGNSSGGTIANKSGSDGDNSQGIGIYLNNTSNVVLRRMTINGTNQNFGIRGFRVNNFTLEYSTVGGTNGTHPTFDNYGEGSIYFGDDASVTTNGLTGSATITNINVSGGRSRNFSVVNTAGTLNRLTITGSAFGLNQNFVDAGDSLSVEARNGGTVLNATVTGSTFTGAPGDLAEFVGQTGTTMDVIFGGVTGTPGTSPGNALSNSHAQNIIGGGGMTLASQGSMSFHVLGNTFRDANGSAITFFKASAGTSLTGYFNNNVIGAAATLDSGSKTGNGIFVSSAGTGTMSFNISNNQIHQIRGNAHIYADNTGGSYTANFDIQNNVLDTPNLAGWFAGIAVTNGSPTSSDTVNVCANIKNNTLNLGGNLGVIVGSSGTNGGHTFNLPGLGSSTEPAVESFIASNNPGGSYTVDAYADAPATFAAFTGAGVNCGTPVSALPDENPMAQNNVATESNEVAQPTTSGLNLASTFNTAELTKQPLANTLRNATANAATNLGNNKPLFAPALSGETVNVTIGTLPAGKSVTIKYRVTVDPLDPGEIRTKVSTQGTVSGSNFSNVLTTNGGPADCETTNDTCTPVDRPDTTVTSITRQSANPTSNSTVTWQITFANPVSGLAASNFTLVNSGLGGSPAITGVTETSGPPSTTWNVTASTGTGSGTLELRVANDASLSHDVTNLPYTEPASGAVYTIDRTAPTVTINQAAGQSDPTGSSPVNFTVVFSEPVSGFNNASDVTLSGTAGADTVNITEIAPNDGTTYNVAVSGMTGDGTVIANVPSNAVQDTAGNNNAASTSTDNSVLYDIAPPTVTINQAGGQVDPTNASPINFTVVFSEAVTDFDDASDVTLSGTAGATTINITGGPTTYNVAVSGMTGDGTVIADVPDGAAKDVANNDNAASTSTDNTVTYDTTQPTVTINQAAGQNDPTGASSINFTVVFSEPVTDFDDAADVTLSGTAGATTVNITGGPTTYNVAVSGMSVNGTVIADVPAGAAKDVANNDNTASTSTDNTVTYDGTAPTVTINQAAGQIDPTGSSPINFTVVFSEAVTDFNDASDITLSGSAGATTSNITEIAPNDGTTYNVAVSGMAGDGTVIAQVPAGAATDGINTNIASTSTDNTVTYDTVAPSVTINQAVGQSDPTGSSPINFTVTFSEDVSDFNDSTDVTLSGTAGATTINITGGPKVYNVAVSGMSSNGTVIADVPAGAALDVASQPNTASTSTDNTVTYDGTVPSVTINQAAGQSDPTNAGPINFTVTFSEAMSDFDDTSDVTLSGTAGATTINITGGPTTYNVAVSGMAGAGTVIAIVPAGAATDGANLNAASTSSDNTVTYDATAPDTIIDSTPANPTSNTTANFTFHGDDGTGVGGLTFTCKLDSGSFVACDTAGTQQYIGLADGSHTFQVRATDSLGNTDASPASYTWTVDTASPSVVVSTTTNPTNTSPVTVTITFNEDVTGFTPSTASGDITIGGVGGTDSNPQTIDAHTYTFDLTPSGQGTVTVQVPSGSAQDAATNFNTVSNTLNIVYDTVAPDVTINQAAGQSDPTGGSPINFTAVFNEAVTGFTNSGVTLSGTAGATTAVVTEVAPMDGTTYNVAVSGMATLGTVIADVQAGAASDLAGNSSTASTSTDNTVTVVAGPPVITEGDETTVLMSEDGNPIPFDLTLHATTPFPDTLTWSILTPPTQGTAGVDSGTGVVSYSPDPNYFGTDSFVVQVSGSGGDDSITVNVTIQPVDDDKLIYEESYRIKYDTWFGAVNSNAFGGGYRQATNGTFTFNPIRAFNKVTWYTYRGPDRGKAQVLVDGVVKKTVDLYSATPEWNYPVVISGLSSKKHTVVIKPLNSKNPLSSGKWISVDAFQVGPRMYDDRNIISNGTISYGSWTGHLNPHAYFGGYRLSKKANATITFSFEGVGITWTTARGPSYGKAAIYVDGVLVKTVDLYRANQQWQYKVTVSGLSYGNHMVVIKVLGTKNPAASGTGIVSDMIATE